MYFIPASALPDTLAISVGGTAIDNFMGWISGPTGMQAMYISTDNVLTVTSAYTIGAKS
jgi:hypothetical protein